MSELFDLRLPDDDLHSQINAMFEKFDGELPVETGAESAFEWINELKRHPDQILIAPGFEAEAALSDTYGPFVEVGGPTAPHKYELVDMTQLPRPLMVSNIQPGTEESLGKVNFRADARKLPLPDASVGALFTNALSRGTAIQEDVEEAKLWAEQERADQLAGLGDPEHPNIVAETQAAVTIIHEGFVAEAGRVVEDGGLLIWGTTWAESAELAERQGFEVVVGKYSDNPSKKFDYILRRLPRLEDDPDN